MKCIAVLGISVLALTSQIGCKKLLQAAADAGPSAATSAAEAKQSTPAEIGTKFTKKPPSVGEKRSSDVTSNVKMKIKAGGQELKLDETETQKKDEEVLEVSGDTITKLKVTYTEDDKTSTGVTGKAKTTKTPINGKTYILAMKDGKVVVTTDKDKPAPKNEEKAVVKDYSSFGKPDPFTAAIPTRALKDGEELPELASAIKDEMLSNQKSDSAKDSITIDTAKVSFKGKDGDVGTFDVAMNVTAGDPNMKMAMPLTGKMSLRTSDAAPTALDLSGPVNLVLSDKDKASGVTGDGTFSVKMAYTYK